jgi:uncharacterized membrane protein
MQHSWNFLIATHAIAASYALIFGAVNLLRPTKGDRPHRIIGFVWLAAMYFVIISSFWIRDLRDGGFSWIHGLSIFTFITISIGLFAAAKHNIKAHRGYMRGSYFGLLGALTGVVVVPTRLIPQLAVNDLLKLVAFLVCISLSAAFFVVSTIHLVRDKRPQTQ